MRIVICLTLLTLSTIGFAGGELTAEAVERKIEECFSDKYRTADLIECGELSYEQWDRLLNESYQGLMKVLADDQKVALRAAQRSWIKYRDLEYENIEMFLKNKRGTMYLPLYSQMKANLTEQRARELTSYLSIERNSHY